MPYTASGRKRTSTDHRLQIEKPTCSEKTEKNRLRRATPFPVDSQNWGSSGRQSSIHRPPLGGAGAGAPEGAAPVVATSVGRVGAAMRTPWRGPVPRPLPYGR